MRLLYIRLLLLCLLTPALLPAQWTFYTGSHGSTAYQLIEEGNFRWLCTNEGLFRSVDGGAHYQRVDAIPEGCYVGTLWVHQDSMATMVSVPGPDVSGPKTAYLYWSVNHGATWQSKPTSILAETLYRGIQYMGDTLIVSSFARMWRSSDGGDTFQEIGPIPGQGIYRFAMTEKALFVSVGGGIYRSQNRGDSWQLVQPLALGANITRFGDTLLVTPSSADSIRVSLDLGDTWQALPPNAASQNGFKSAGRNGRVYSAFKQILYTDDLGASWQTLTVGNSGTFFGTYENDQGIWGFSEQGLMRIDPGNGQLQLEAEGTISGYHQYWVKNLNGKLYAFTSDDTWSASTDARHWSAPVKLPGSSSLVYGLERVNDTLLLLNGLKFYFSANEGQSWTAMPDSFSYPGTISIQNGVLLVGDEKGIWRANSVLGPWTRMLPGNASITGVLTTPDKWFASSVDGTLRTSTDQGLTWTVVAQLGPSNLSSVHSLQYIEGKVYYFGANTLMRTAADDGVFWEVCPGVEPGALYSDIAGYGNLLFLGTYGKGLYYSSDGGLNWSSFGKFENQHIRTATLWNNKLLITVFGEGIWTYQLDLLAYPVQAFSDDNQNQVWDAGENPFQGLIVRAKNGAYASSDTSGLIRVFGAAPEDSLFTYPPALFTNITPKQIALTSILDTPQIAVHKLSVFDLRISLVNLRPLTPGTNTDFHLICENIGSETQDAEVVFRFPPELTFISAEEPVASLGPDSATWVLPGFKSGATRTIRVTLRTATTVVPGNTISIDAAIEPSDDIDINVKDNTSGLRLVVRGSYDPNDKTARLGDRITPQQLADSTPVEYLIRFQNTGNYPATFIRIIDTLQANFDPATFRFLGSSHPCQWELKGSGIVDFFFDDIQLPDSVSNEPESHGFVTFSIQPISGLVLGDTLANTAFIYFDYNAPVQTNTAETVVSEPVKVLTPALDRTPDLVCYPNPATQLVYLQKPDEQATFGGQIWIWDASGRLVWQQRDTGSSALMTVQLAGWPAGWYRVGWQQRGGSVLWGRFLKN